MLFRRQKRLCSCNFSLYPSLQNTSVDQGHKQIGRLNYQEQMLFDKYNCTRISQ